MTQHTLASFVKAVKGILPENIIQQGKRYYQATPELVKIKEHITKDPYCIGLPLGEQKSTFYPTVALLDLIKAKQVTVINKKSAWLFLCDRDVFQESVEEAPTKDGITIVENELGEVLGFGEFKNNKVRNLLDRGDFLRREH